ncbi:MAG: DUF4038 domain-containing protein [Chloroflexi bacterium]|nr:DUF4038 domain-containing protein [Chloroflexota bacterium]
MNTHIWESAELSFEATTAYDNPFRDIALYGEFFGPNGEVLRVPGFWDGAQTWRIRFAPTAAGRWTWRTLCSKVDDDDLHNRSGELIAAPWSPADIDANPTRRGFVRVHESGRYFEYADDTPFYWLGDTLWGANTTRFDEKEHLPVYVADRVAKGFTVIQMVVGRPALYDKPDEALIWTINEAGMPYTEPFERINPEYFHYLDVKIMAMLEAGLVPCLLGGWGPDLETMGVKHFQEFWHYLIARYTAYNVVWCVAGEYFFAPDVAGWREVGRFVHENDPYEHPTSNHSTAPHSGSRHYQADDWYDFNLVQVGHALALRKFMDTLAWDDYHALPVKPSIMSESWYEAHPTCLDEGDFLFDDADIRLATYIPVLQGCIGQTYGAHGIWSWETETDPPLGVKYIGFKSMPHWEEALHLPGGAQMRHLRDLMDSVAWWELAPHPEIVSATDPCQVYCAANLGHEYVVYMRNAQKQVNVFLPPVGSTPDPADYASQWFDPRTGAWADAEPHVTNWYGSFLRWEVIPPDAQDWVLVVRRRT